MTKKYWIETTLQDLSESEIDALFSKYIIIFERNRKTRGIYLFTIFVKLSPQEYKFLKAVLNLKKGKRGEDILMSIGAVCGSKKYSLQDYSYTIANKIKKKILKEFNKVKYLSEDEYINRQNLKKEKRKKNINALKKNIRKQEKSRLEKYKNKTYYTIPSEENVDWFKLIDSKNLKENDAPSITEINYGDGTQEIDLTEYLDNLIYCKDGKFKALWPFAKKY